MFADRVREVTTTTGTGTVTLAGASSGFQAFTTAFSTGAVVDYTLVSGTAWEMGRGVFTTSGLTLSREEVYSSSAAGAKISLAGTSDVFVSVSATALTGKQSLHGFNLTTSAPSAITNGLRRVSIDNGQNVDSSYDTSTRIVTLAQTGGVTYWYKGNKVTLGASVPTPAHSTTAGAYYIYFSDANGTITVSGTPWNLAEHVPIAEVYWDGTKGTAWDERHSAQRDPAVHSYLHNTQGARWASGGVLSGYTLELGTNAGVSVALTSATIYDEDIRVATTALPDAGPYTLWFKSAGVWTWDSTPTVPYKSGTYIQYNNAGTLTDLVPGEFVNIYQYGATSLLAEQQVIHHIGQQKFNNLGDALDEPLSAMDFTGFPSPETAPLYRLTYYCDPTSAATGKAVLVDVTRLNGDRNFSPVSSTSTRDPGNITMGRLVASARGFNTWM